MPQPISLPIYLPLVQATPVCLLVQRAPQVCQLGPVLEGPAAQMLECQLVRQAVRQPCTLTGGSDFRSFGHGHGAHPVKGWVDEGIGYWTLLSDGGQEGNYC